MKKGIVFNIQKFSIHDGPGIRTTVFLKGCPLNCQWCANPESQIEKIQILYDQKKCSHCQTCVNTCQTDAIHHENKRIYINHDKCIGCLQCINHCPTHALTHEGEYKEIDEIVEICLQDQDFYEESDGGVTISGGEGLSQPEFVKNLVTELKKHNLHVAIETTGYIKPEIFQELASMFDLLLFDVKHYETNKHRKGTGVNNELILQNLKWAHEKGINILCRIPVIPKFNDTIEDATGFSKLFNELNIDQVQLLPFHQFGQKKYELLNRKYQYADIKALYPEDLQDYQKIFLNHNINCFF